MKKKYIAKLLIVSILFSSISVFSQTDNRGVNTKQNASTNVEKRLALVIGNGAYKNTSPLANPVNDANDIAASLKNLGFEVLSGTNQSKREMEVLIRQFRDKLAKQGGVGLFFYAGHGLQVNGNNYLIPIEADIPEQDEVEYQAVNLSFLLGKMGSASNGLNIVILDACRNNPFARSWRNFRDIGDKGGLAKVTPPTGTIMLYATQPGNVASDGTGRNGLFTESLLQQIKKPNVELDAMVKLLARDVSAKSNGKQLPWKEGIVLGDFYFASGENTKPTPQRTETAINETKPEDVERESWLDIQNSTNPQVFRSFLKEYPNGANAGKAKIRLEQLVWDAVKDSGDKKKLQDYLTEFPNGANVSRAKLKLESLNTVFTPPTNPTSTDSNANEITNTIGMKFVKIPGKNFAMGRYEVTQAEWKAVMGSLPTKCDDGSLSGEFLGDRKPIICVSWEDVQEYIKKLNTKGIGKYRLPTESDWEYSARAGTTTEYYWGNDENQAGDYAWYSANSGNKTHEVGLKKPNAFGLYDMSGNVWEWCEDIQATYHIIRGGSWFLNHLYFGHSGSDLPSKSSSGLGFRLIREN